MFSWLNRKMQCDQQSKLCDDIINELKMIYTENILPLEREFLFNGTYLDECYFDVKPTIVVTGQRSSGKTSLIKYLLGKDYLGIRSKCEIDKFAILSYENMKRKLSSHDLNCCQECESFRNFLDRFEYLEVKSALLKNLTIVDSPGILTDCKSVDGKHEYAKTLRWLAKRAQLIIFVFDSQSIDLTVVSAIQALKCHGDKIRIVLNKADGLDPIRLMEVYGKLMWSLGKVSNAERMDKVYVGSFWNKPVWLGTNKQFFQSEERRLFNDVCNLPTVAATDKLECLIKRANLIKAQALIISHVCKKSYGGRGMEDIIKNLDDMYAEIRKEYSVSAELLPDIEIMKDRLRNISLEKLIDLKRGIINRIDDILNGSLAGIKTMIPQENTKQIDDVGVKAEESMLVYLIVFLVVYVLVFKGF